MKRFTIAALAALIALSACGIKRPLVKPMDIPAYEAKIKKKREKYEQDDAAVGAVDAAE